MAEILAEARALLALKDLQAWPFGLALGIVEGLTKVFFRKPRTR